MDDVRIRVVHVYPRLCCGGVERVIENLIRFGDRERFSFAVLTQEEGDYEEVFREMGVEIFRIPTGGGMGEYRKQLKAFFRDNHFDVVHSHMHHEMMTVNKMAKKAGVKCRVAHSHINHQDWPWWKRILRIPKFAFHNQGATDLVGCSEGALDWLFPVRRGGTVIPNGIDAQKFAYSDKKRYSKRRAMGISPDKKVMLNVGRLAHQKNQKFLLEVAEEMKDKDDYLFLIAGSGPMDEELRGIIKEKELDNVRMLGECHDVPALMAASDIFLMPSLYEGASSIAMREALASGLPVIFNNKLGPGADVKSGRVCPMSIDDVSEWVKGIEVISPKALLNNREIGLPYRYVMVKSDVREMAELAEELYRRRLYMSR